MRYGRSLSCRVERFGLVGFVEVWMRFGWGWSFPSMWSWALFVQCGRKLIAHTCLIVSLQTWNPAKGIKTQPSKTTIEFVVFSSLLLLQRVYYPLPNTQIPLFSYSWDLARATRLARLFEQHLPDQKITLIGSHQLLKITLIGSHQSFKITLIGRANKKRFPPIVIALLTQCLCSSDQQWLGESETRLLASFCQPHLVADAGLRKSSREHTEAKNAKHDLFVYNQSWDTWSSQKQEERWQN